MHKVLLFMVLICTSTATAQVRPDSFLPETVDARSTALGRTAIVASGGSSAIFTNPATLASLRQWNLQGGGRLLFGIVDDDAQDESSEIRFTPQASFDHVTFSMAHRSPNNEISIGYGLGYQTYYDFGFSLAVGEDGEVTQRVRGGLNTLSPAIALGIKDKVFFGGSYHKSVLAGITTKLERPDREPFDDEIETSASFYLVGGLVQVSSALSVGFTYRPSFRWNWTLDDDTELEWSFPDLYGIGAAYQLSDTATLFGEYQNRPFSEYDGPGNAFTVKDGNNWRLGAEFGRETLVRFGLFRDALNVNDTGDSKPRPLLGITGGLGFRIGRVYIDTALEYATWRREFSEGQHYSEELYRVRTSVQFRSGKTTARPEPSAGEVRPAAQKQKPPLTRQPEPAQAEPVRPRAAETRPESDPGTVLQTVFDAATSGNFSALEGICDPLKENDGYTQRICDTTTREADQQEFVAYFSRGKVDGRARWGTDRGSVQIPILFGKEGSDRGTMVLIKRDVTWYLYRLR